MGFRVEVPRKRPRNALFLAQARGEMLKPRKMGDKRRSKKREALIRGDGMSNLSNRVAASWLEMQPETGPRFDLEGRQFEELKDAAQEAEFLHAEDGRPRIVTAIADDPHGMFEAGETVYASKGAPDDD